ncbi:TIGR03826 family flagellar region protein [Sporosarcina limicola]|uniref:Flagellar operon protein (TIGR03826 family) n=1 Tax=Sporosarcina limicola TaxID=34101 RepID=A0A927MJH2_9BACL|nr:TIGR03826 family flagellar region protein [Sporosarcina limicola]MBE1555006.1 flagellar operon protein (TIGR03826 family) [Sporosarcina limicola]
MAELRNCPTCEDIFNFTGAREVCAKCTMDEEKMFEEVYRFLRRRGNRSATIEQIVEQTGMSKSLLHNWVRRGRLQPALFPNLGYPCNSCGGLTNKGKLCDRCTTDIKKDLKTFEAAQAFREAQEKRNKLTYHLDRNKD